MRGGGRVERSGMVCRRQGLGGGGTGRRQAMRGELRRSRKQQRMRRRRLALE